MNPRIVDSPEKKLVGMRIEMSLLNNQTVKLWKTFMPRRLEIKNRLDNLYFSLQGTDPSKTMQDVNLTQVFTKWALVEVSSFNNTPVGMVEFTLKEGKYAVFVHEGNSVPEFIDHIKSILGTWLPNSLYQLDNRPNFEILPEDYRLNPELTEEIWIPIK